MKDFSVKMLNYKTCINTSLSLLYSVSESVDKDSSDDSNKSKNLAAW